MIVIAQVERARTSSRGIGRSQGYARSVPRSPERRSHHLRRRGPSGPFGVSGRLAVRPTCDHPERDDRSDDQGRERMADDGLEGAREFRERLLEQLVANDPRRQLEAERERLLAGPREAIRRAREQVVAESRQLEAQRTRIIDDSRQFLANQRSLVAQRVRAEQRLQRVAPGHLQCRWRPARASRVPRSRRVRSPRRARAPARRSSDPPHHEHVAHAAGRRP